MGKDQGKETCCRHGLKIKAFFLPLAWQLEFLSYPPRVARPYLRAQWKAWSQLMMRLGEVVRPSAVLRIIYPHISPGFASNAWSRLAFLPAPAAWVEGHFPHVMCMTFRVPFFICGSSTVWESEGDATKLSQMCSEAVGVRSSRCLSIEHLPISDWWLAWDDAVIHFYGSHVECCWSFSLCEGEGHCLLQDFIYRLI